MQEKNSAILFDLDGTLLNSGLTFHKIVNQLKKEINQEEVPFEKVRKYSLRTPEIKKKKKISLQTSQELRKKKGSD